MEHKNSKPRLTGEQKMRAFMAQVMWNGKRESFRAYRGSVHVLFHNGSGRLLCRKGTRVYVDDVTPAMDGVVFYGSKEQAEDGLKAITALSPKVQLTVASAYEYCKAREYVIRAATSEMAKS